jgi:hypothetical protein
VPFKPRIIRFDDEHAGVPEPRSGGSAAPLATATDSAPPVETPLCDPTHDTVRGLEFDSVRDLDGNDLDGSEWDIDDLLLSDPKLQCLARQLSDDAAALANRYPADGWEPPAMESSPVVASSQSKSASPLHRRVRALFPGQVAWRRWLGLSVAAAACVAVAIGPRSLPNANPTKFDPANRIVPSTADPMFAASPTQQVNYQDGDEAIWGPELVDDSQFGESPFGSDGAGNVRDDVLSTPGHDALRELLPADSHDYCEVSM